MYSLLAAVAAAVVMVDLAAAAVKFAEAHKFRQQTPQ
jgi:hypothetical protein